MSKPIRDFLGYHVGDIITLSDIQTQTEYNELSADFRIMEVRTYKEPTGSFTYTCYIAEYQTGKYPSTIMVMIRSIGPNFDLRVFYKDQSGQASDYVDAVITADKQNLIDRFQVTLHFDDIGDKDVTWDRQGDAWFGIKTHSTDTGEDHKTFAEYFTNDETKGNPHCFIEWTGDTENGWIEVWYGCEIRPNDIELFHNKKI